MSNQEKQKWRYKIAFAVRVATVPPVMVGILLLLLYLYRKDLFGVPADMIVSACLLAALPLLAYPLSIMIPALRKKGREGQRSLAMYLSAAGYLAVFVYGIIADVSVGLMHLYGGYLLSVIIILVGNKLLHIRISGHACAVTGPLVYSGYFLGLWGILVGVVCWIVILWASLAMKRHTVREFLLGTATCLVSFFTALAFFH